MIGRAGVGVDNVDVDAATRRGIIVANAPESTVVSAAEHTIGLLVALARNIPQAHAALKQGRWERSAYGGIELAGKTLGVLGFGRIGQQVARRALGLGMHVVAYDPYVTAERFRELGAERVESPEDVYAAADFLTLHLPLTAETRGSVDAAAFEAMRARRADRQRRPRRARSTRTRCSRRCAPGRSPARRSTSSSSEPYTGPLLELDNVVVTPHLAASTGEAQDRAGVIVAEQVAAALEGGLVSNAVNIPVIGADDLEVARPVRAARVAARPHRDGARRRRGRGDRDHGLRRPRGLRHAPPHRRGAQRCLPGPRRPSGQLRQRAADRGRARHRGAGRALALGPRLHEPRPRRAAQRRLRASRVAGTTIGSDNRPWLVNVLGFEIELELAPLFVLCRYDDVPGVIGRVGTLFGEAGINIAGMTVSRSRRGGKALMALTVDSAPSPELVERLRGRGLRRRPRARARARRGLES